MSEENIQPEQTRILVVDDEDTMRLLMKAALTDSGYIVDDVNNGPDALNSIENHIPAMVLLDVKMPGMSGYEVCSEIRKHYNDKNISIVMVTGLDDPDSIEKAFMLGATAFINKPINWDTFPYQIQYLLKARGAIVALKQSEKHLEYMDRISQILTQSEDRNLVLKEVLDEILEIFHADRAFILHTHEADITSTDITYESLSNRCKSLKQREENIIEEMGHSVLQRAKISEFPVVSIFTDKDPSSSITGKHSIPNQMLKALYVDNDETWFLVIHQNDQPRPWTELEQETLLRIGLRLGAVLSRHLLMEKLHDNEKLLKQAQHIGHLGNWRWALKTGKLSWSDEIYNIYGRDPNVYRPHYEDFFKIDFEEDHARLKQFEQSILKPGNNHSFEHRIKLPNGDVRWVHEQGIGTFDEYGTLLEVNGTIQDITERIKKQEQEIHDQKMDAIGQLTSGVAHDFGNLMTIAQCNLELLDEEITNMVNIKEDTKEILDDTRSAIYDGVELTKQLLAFSHKKSIAPEYINVAEKAKNFSKLIKNTLGDKIKLSLKIQKGLPDILVDSVQFESSLLNTIINARDAMPSGGQLTIQAVVQPPPKNLNLHTLDSPIASQYVCISIMDTGTGMSNETVKRAIEPFFTTKKSEGTGLGLSMVYGFIRQSKGDLEIDSGPGKGTSIKMWFPVYEEQKITKKMVVQHKIQPFAQETILVVEDNPAVRRFAVRCLGHLGLNILEAEDASVAQQQLASNNIDLLFTDILMPGEMTGRELAAWAADSNPHLKILLTTAAEKEAQQQNKVADQGFPMLLKPYNKQTLIESIRNIL